MPRKPSLPSEMRKRALYVLIDNEADPNNVDNHVLSTRVSLSEAFKSAKPNRLSVKRWNGQVYTTRGARVQLELVVRYLAAPAPVKVELSPAMLKQIAKVHELSNFTEGGLQQAVARVLHWTQSAPQDVELLRRVLRRLNIQMSGYFYQRKGGLIVLALIAGQRPAAEAILKQRGMQKTMNLIRTSDAAAMWRTYEKRRPDGSHPAIPTMGRQKKIRAAWHATRHLLDNRATLK